MGKFQKTTSALLLAVGLLDLACGCTNIIVSPSASASGLAMIGDNDDSSKRFGGVTQ